MLKSYLNFLKYVAPLGLGIVATLSVYFAIKDWKSFNEFVGWGQDNVLLFSLLILFVKFAGIVIPPIPGVVFTLSSIPIVGWPLALFLDLLGSLLGTSVNYVIGRYLGYPFLKRFFPKSSIKLIERIKFRPQHEIESIFMFRVAGNFAAEFIALAAGLLKASYHKFIIATVLAHVVIATPIFYFVGTISKEKQTFQMVFSVILILVAIFVIYQSRHRYVEIDKDGESKEDFNFPLE